MTTCGDVSDNKVGIMTTLNLQWLCSSTKGRMGYSWILRVVICIMFAILLSSAKCLFRPQCVNQNQIKLNFNYHYHDYKQHRIPRVVLNCLHYHSVDVGSVCVGCRSSCGISWSCGAEHAGISPPRSWMLQRDMLTAGKQSEKEATGGLSSRLYIDGLEQDCSNSCVLAMELLQSCTNKPLIWKWSF